jgi:hypothetical protein
MEGEKRWLNTSELQKRKDSSLLLLLYCCYYLHYILVVSISIINIKHDVLITKKFCRTIELLLVRANSKITDKEEDTDNINPIVLKLAFRGKISAYDISLDSLQALISDGLAIQKDGELFATDKCKEYAPTLRNLANFG